VLPDDLGDLAQQRAALARGAVPPVLVVGAAAVAYRPVDQFLVGGEDLSQRFAGGRLDHLEPARPRRLDPLPAHECPPPAAT
jgi:hypothetical protein